MFDDELVCLSEGSPALILEQILKKKWSMNASDLDMIVMLHKFEYFEEDKLKVINAYMVASGEDADNTGMAKTVGLPVGIATKLILENKISLKGVQIPVKKEIYKPILNELKNQGIEVVEEIPREIKIPDNNL